jgi:hypothetical protein
MSERDEFDSSLDGPADIKPMSPEQKAAVLEQMRIESINRRRLFRIGISVEALFKIIASQSNLLSLYPDAAPITGMASINFSTGDQHYELVCHSKLAIPVDDGTLIPVIRNVTVTEVKEDVKI